MAKPAARASSTAALDVGRVVGAAERGEHVGATRLHAERQPVDARRRGRRRPAPASTSSGLHSTVTSRPAAAGHASRTATSSVGGHQRRRAAADEHPGDRGQARGHQAVGVGAAGREVGVDQVVAVGPGREGAVVAARRAERHVDVDAEGHGRPPMVAGERGGGRWSRLTARPRSSSASRPCVGRDVEDAGDGPEVVTADREHPAVEVPALHLDHRQVPVSISASGPRAASRRVEVDA